MGFNLQLVDEEESPRKWVESCVFSFSYGFLALGPHQTQDRAAKSLHDRNLSTPWMRERKVLRVLIRGREDGEIAILGLWALPPIK